MKQIEIQTLVEPIHENANWSGSRKKCRTCNVLYKEGFERNYCLKCGKRLAIKAKQNWYRTLKGNV